MSVYIKGMEMPIGELGAVPVIIFADGTVHHYMTLEFVGNAIPVPDHGRLIEAEPIMKFITDGLNSGEFGYDQIKVLAEIQYAPTIIPADHTNKEN